MWHRRSQRRRLRASRWVRRGGAGASRRPQPSTEQARPAAPEPPPLQVPEGLPPAERAALCARGDPVQQRFLVDNLRGLVCEAGPAALAALAEPVGTLAAAADEECASALADGLAAALQACVPGGPAPAAGAHPAADAAATATPALVCKLLPLVLPRATNASSPPAVLEAWLACLASLAAIANGDTLRGRLLPAALALGAQQVGGAGALAARCLCARLLGLLAPALGAETAESPLLSMALTLCQVRAASSHILRARAKGGVDLSWPPTCLLGLSLHP